jgi:hypothetical protein
MRCLLRTFLSGDLKEHILQAHSNRTKLQQSPSTSDNNARQIAADVDIWFALDLEREWS